jgi:threonyl-tRNA synthetase
MLSEKVTLTLPDKSTVEVDKGLSGAEIAKQINKKLFKKAVVYKYNGKLYDLAEPVNEDGVIEFITEDSEEAIEILRHSAAHVMAQAVKELFPKAKVTIGPAIENGFYYDFDFEDGFTPDDIKKIEKKMDYIIKQNIPFTKKVVTKEEAIDFFKEQNEDFKVEIIEELPEDEEIKLYTQGSFTDLCRGPHIPSTGKIKAFKLLNIAGAYWRGDENNKMLQRIYGTAFFSKEDLKKYLDFLEEAKRRDHRKLGKELELFSINEDAGAGFIIWHPKGTLLRMAIEDWEKKEHLKRGYDIVMGPQILKLDLWKKSGHYENYRENMYFTKIDDDEYGIKPMNCISHMLIYKSKLRSYRDLPVRFFELGTVYRHEKSGVLHGLLRVRGFTQDDAHIICTPEQLNEEITNIITFVKDVMDIFGFSYSMEVSTRPDKSIGSDEDWERATSALFKALEFNNLTYDINEGDGAFYGPKIDVKLKDAIGREWQCATIQCDFTLPQKFDLTYIGEDGLKHRPVMLHRVILGSIERFIGVLIEHFAGNFPVWLSPTQVIVLPVSEKYIDYAEKMYEFLIKNDIRAEIDRRGEKLGFKIREAQLNKIPYMIIVGEKEQETDTISVRKRTREDIGNIKKEDFLNLIKDDIINFRRW